MNLSRITDIGFVESNILLDERNEDVQAVGDMDDIADSGTVKVKCYCEAGREIGQMTCIGDFVGISRVPSPYLTSPLPAPSSSLKKPARISKILPLRFLVQGRKSKHPSEPQTSSCPPDLRFSSEADIRQAAFLPAIAGPRIESHLFVGVAADSVFRRNRA